MRSLFIGLALLVVNVAASAQQQESDFGSWTLRKHTIRASNQSHTWLQYEPGHFLCFPGHGASSGYVHVAHSRQKAESKKPKKSRMYGFGDAVDHCVGTEGTGSGWNSGVYLERWTYKGPGSGEVEVDCDLSIGAEVDLVEGPCAAAALGFVEFDSSVGGIRVDLEKSKGATTTTGWGSLDLGDFASIELGSDSDHGVKPDGGTDGLSEQEKTNAFWFKHILKGHLALWANEGLTNSSKSECYAEIFEEQTFIETTYTLGIAEQ